MSQTLRDMKDNLRRIVDVRVHTKQHPLLITGSAVVVGFVTGAALTPSRRRKQKKRWPSSVAEVHQDRLVPEVEKARKSRLLSTVGAILVGVLKMVVQGMIVSPVSSSDRIETRPPQDADGLVGRENGAA
jgi:hypothetical protein